MTAQFKPGPNCYRHLKTGLYRGFTLLELMIVLLLITVLVAMAVPSYQQYLQRSHRVMAAEALLAAASCQQSIYAAEFHYDTRRCIPAESGNRYSYRMEPADAASTIVFAVIASPLGAQQQDACKQLSLDQSGWRGIGGPEELQRKCWEGR
jgi:type IV pilus assembly protein PilE